MVKVVFCFMLLLFITVVNTAAEAKCNGGAECITLESCTVIHNSLLSQSNHRLTKLLQSLHCGFDNIKPKICCPPEFRTVTEVMNRDNFPLDFENTESNPNSLMFDGQICGIQVQNKKLAKHPWTALLKYEKTIGWGFFCSGVLISSKYVLTTASCVVGKDLPSTWTLNQVRLGEWDTSTSTDCYRNECSDPHLDIPIEKIIIHGKYDPTDGSQFNDIALLRLIQDVQFTDYIKPICLPMDARTHAFENYVAQVAGWGEIESHYNSKLKEISTFSIISATECSNIFGRDINASNQICAVGAKGSETCLGDYGGALLGHAANELNWLSLGLLSYRPISCRSPEFPSIYTRVDAYIDWIAQTMEP